MIGNRSNGSVVAFTRLINPMFAVFAAEQISYTKVENVVVKKKYSIINIHHLNQLLLCTILLQRIIPAPDRRYNRLCFQEFQSSLKIIEKWKEIIVKLAWSEKDTCIINFKKKHVPKP